MALRLGWGHQGRVHPSDRGHAARACPHQFMGTPRLQGAPGGLGRGQDTQPPPHKPCSPHPRHEHSLVVFLFHETSLQLGGVDGHVLCHGLVGVDGHAVVHGVAQQLLAGPGPAGETPGYVGDGHRTPPRPHGREDERPRPQLHSRGVVGQEQGAGARGGLGHHVQLLRSWEKERRGGSGACAAGTRPGRTDGLTPICLGGR